MGFWARIFNAHVPLVASRSGHQLMLLDRRFALPGGRRGGTASDSAGSRTGGSEAQPARTRRPWPFETAGGEGTSPATPRGASPLRGRSPRRGMTPSGGSPRSGTSAGGSPPGGSPRGGTDDEGSDASGSGRVRAARRSRRSVGLEGRPAPLLVLMAHPSGPFYEGLARFRRRIRVANIKWAVAPCGGARGTRAKKCRGASLVV
jgi:hypothetical protein